MPLADSFQMRLTEPQMARLAIIIASTGLTRAELVRRAMDYYLDAWPGPVFEAAATELAAPFGLGRLAEPPARPVSSRQPARIARR